MSKVLMVNDCPTEAERKVCMAAYQKALYHGELVRARVCEWCGSDYRIEGHHPDYNRPLMVVWVCHRCHKKHHADYANEHSMRRATKQEGRNSSSCVTK